MSKKLDDSLFEDVSYEDESTDSSLFEDVPYEEPTSNFLENATKDVSKTVASGVLGGLAGKTAQIGGRMLASEKVAFLGNLQKAARHSAMGESVTSPSAEGRFVKKSEDLAKELKEKVRSERDISKKKLDKIFRLADKKVSKKNINEILNKIKKEVAEITPPSDESILRKKELLNVLEGEKVSDKTVTIKPKGDVKTGLEDALEKLDRIKKKDIFESEELGELKSYGPDKVNKDLGLVSSTDLSKGKVKTVPIKAGKYTPIDIIEESTDYTPKMTTQEIKTLQKSINEVRDQALPTSLIKGKASSASKELKDVIESNIKEGLGEKSLGTYKKSNKRYSDLGDELYELLPSLKETEKADLDLSSFMRSLGEKGSSTTDKTRILESVLGRVYKEDPKKAEVLYRDILKNAERYDLTNVLSGKHGGPFVQLGENISIRAGDMLGSLARPAVKLAQKAEEISPEAIKKALGVTGDVLKKGGSKFMENLPTIGAVLGASLSFQEARADGLDVVDSLKKAAADEGVDIALGLGSLALPEKSGPKRGTVDYKMEHGLPLTDEEKRIAYPSYFNKKDLKQNRKESEKKMYNMSSGDISDLSNRMKEKFPEKTQFLAPLEKAAQAEGRSKTAIMYGLNQQPAFRQMMDRLLSDKEAEGEDE